MAPRIVDRVAAATLLLALACDGAASDQAADAGAQPADAGLTCSPGEVAGGGPASTDIPHVVVDADLEGFDVAPVLLGANINKWYGHAQGLWDPDARAPVADAADKAREAGVGLLRHPGGTSANLFDWKRSVGPIAARRCQIDGESGAGHPDTDYGPSEFMTLVRAVGAEPQIMVPFASESPADAADWVEYMNAPVGTNPNGGIAWAEVRAADGSPEPYSVTRWEIGNEQDRGGHQAYWMATSSDPSPSDADRARLAQYIDGATIRFVDQPAARGCDLERTTSNGAPGQTFTIRYGLIAAGTSPTVEVGGTPWTRVDDLATAGAGDRVYTLDRQDASFAFGDGVHGAIPPAGATVTITYTFHHAGFVAMYDAMKDTARQIGIDIDVCAAWAPPSPLGTDLDTLGMPSFPAAMRARGLADRYDCVAMHPYTNFARDFGDAWDGPAEGHNEHMLGDGWSRAMVEDLTGEVSALSAPGADGRAAFVTISELGALWFGGGPAAEASQAAMPAFSATMTHALFMASQWIHFARLGVRWVEGNTLVAEPSSIRGTLGGSDTGFVVGAEAMVREALAPVFAEGGRWTASSVDGQPVVTVGDQGSWPVLVVAATTGADGALRIALVNRRMFSAQEAIIDPGAYQHGATVEVTSVAAATFASYVDGPDGAGDDAVTLTRTILEVDTAAFTVSLPAASVTVLTLRPPC